MTLGLEKDVENKLPLGGSLVARALEMIKEYLLFLPHRSASTLILLFETVNWNAAASGVTFRLRAKLSSESADFVAQAFHLIEELLLILLLLAGFLTLDEDRSARLENTRLDVVKMLEALPVGYRPEILFGEKLFSKSIPPDLAILDEGCRFALENLIQPPVTKEEPDHEVVHAQKAEAADQSSCDRVIVTDDRVLDRVGEREQDYEVERIELCQLALSENSQRENEE